MSASGQEASIRIGQVPPTVSIHTWPLRDEGWRAWLLVLAIVGISSFCGWYSSQGMGVLSFVALFLVTWRLWLPMRIELRPKGVLQTVLGRTAHVPWSGIRRHEVRRHGVLLFADAVSHPTSAFRCLYVPWLDQREELLHAIHFYASTRVSTSSTRTIFEPREK